VILSSLGLAELPDYWDPGLLHYRAGFEVGGSSLTLDDHDVAEVVWFSSDADHPLADPDFVTREVIPQRLYYSGAPLPRWWQIERHAVDIGGFPPDRCALRDHLVDRFDLRSCRRLVYHPGVAARAIT
jgi:hypothetical protein